MENDLLQKKSCFDFRSWVDSNYAKLTGDDLGLIEMIFPKFTKFALVL